MSGRHEFMTKISSLFYVILTDCVSFSLNHEVENNMLYSSTNNNITSLPLSLYILFCIFDIKVDTSRPHNTQNCYFQWKKTRLTLKLLLQLIIDLCIFNLFFASISISIKLFISRLM